MQMNEYHYATAAFAKAQKLLEEEYEEKKISLEPMYDLEKPNATFIINMRKSTISGLAQTDFILAWRLFQKGRA